MQYLKKHTRAHKFRELLSNDEIEKILKKYEHKIRIPDFNFRDYPEMDDVYREMIDRVVVTARDELKKKFYNRYIAKFRGQDGFHVKEYLKTI